MTRVTLQVRFLLPGDVLFDGVSKDGSPLTDQDVDVGGSLAIVDFTDGTASPPLAAATLATVDRPDAWFEGWTGSPEVEFRAVS